MSIKIELIFDTIDEAAAGLATLAQRFLSLTSANTLDIARHNQHIEDASPAEEAAASSELSVPKRGRGRPPKPKVADAPPCSEVTESPAGEATEPEASVTEQDVQDVIAKLTQKFRDGDDSIRAGIRAWRDELGLGKMTDLKPEHVPAAREFLSSLEG
jgi:hypothetical protein